MRTELKTVNTAVTSTKRLMAALLALFAIVVALYPRSAAAQVPAPVADYRFQGNLNDSLGVGPTLQQLGTGATAFETEMVAGASRTVYTFPQSNGLSLGDTSAVVPNDNYTIAILFRIEDTLGYRRLIDFKDGASDSGLYSYDGSVYWFPGIAGSSQTITANRYAQVVITRNAADSNVHVYDDGSQQITFSDTGESAIIDVANVLNFFKDDTAVDGEESAGAVARIRFWGTALTPQEIAALDDNQPDTEPSPSPSPTEEPPPVTVEADVTIKYNGEFFNGYVRPEGDGGAGFAHQVEEPENLCDNGRQVRIKHEEPGKDPSVGRDVSNYKGYYRVIEDAIPDDVYYSVVKRKKITLDTGEEIICTRTESRHLRAPRQ